MNYTGGIHALTMAFVHRDRMLCTRWWILIWTYSGFTRLLSLI